MRNLYLDPNTADLAVDSSFDLRFTVNLVEYVSQRIENVLKTFQGEWFLDETLGLPFFDRILIKRADINDVINIFRSAVLSIPEVQELITFEVTQNTQTRLFSATLEARISEEETTGEITVEGIGG
jgi:hypothetical protein